MSPVAFHVFGWPIYWYGISYIVSFLIGKYLAVTLSGISSQIWDKAITYLIIGCIVGGRIGYVVFYDPNWFLNSPIEIIKVYNGGMSFHGGVIGFLISGFIFVKKYNLPFLKLADFVAICSTPGIFFVRLANFINQEHFGRVIKNPLIAEILGVTYTRANDNLLRYPSQILEAVFEGLFLGLVVLIILKKFYRFEGIVFSIFCIGYSLIRFLLEYIREPDGFVFCLTTGQFLSLLLFMIGVYVIFKNMPFRKI